MSSVKDCFSVCHFLMVFGGCKAHPSRRSLTSTQTVSGQREHCPILDPIAWPLSSHTGALVVFSDPCRPQALLWTMS